MGSKNLKKSSSANEPSRRVEKASQQVQKIIAQYLIRNMRGELPCLATVSRVEMSIDLRYAKVFVSLLSVDNQDEKMTKQVIQILNDESAEIQHQLAKELPMKHCPRVSFLHDTGLTKALEIEGILRGLKKNNSESEE